MYSGDSLTGEILSQTFDDLNGKIQGEVDRLASKAQSRCAGAVTPLAQLFPGSCTGAGSIPNLVNCVAGIARAHFYASLVGTHGLAIECDLTDDGVADESCISPAQRQHLLDRVGYGPDAYTIGRLQALGAQRRTSTSSSTRRRSTTARSRPCSPATIRAWR